MLAWLLECAGLRPGYLVGAVPLDFGQSARLGDPQYFVVEADEYDCAYFDKRAKFVHYRPKTLVITNIEFDHADIFADLAAIRREFHHLVRTVPGSGIILCNGNDGEIAKVLEMGCWTPVQRFGDEDPAAWRIVPALPDYSRYSVASPAGHEISITSHMLGRHNAENAVAAMAAANAVGIPPDQSGEALTRFRGVQRRLQTIGSPRGVTIYDDFAHHPTAIRATLESLRRHVGGARIIAVMEPRSNTMKLGIHARDLAPSIAAADQAIILHPPGLKWDLRGAMTGATVPCHVAESIEEIIETVASVARCGDHVVIMSNGGFGGIHRRLVEILQ
jgi:UDP-N-acetylmuramate: L-alanyl-gamma-D-glutamyl-meso-diaminopimelate ligase